MTHAATTTRATTVWVEIPVSDLDAATDFYNAVFQWGMTPMEMGGERVAAFGRDGVGGNLSTSWQTGRGRGNAIFLEVPDTLQAALDRAVAAGALVQGDPVGLPKGRYQLIDDPDGNRIGLFRSA